MSKIIRTECPEKERLDFLFNRVGRDFFRYEQTTFAYMDEACKEYSGGYWNFYNLSNGSFYMALFEENPLRMQWIQNAYQGRMSADAAGIAIGLMVQNRFACEVDAGRYGDYYYALRDYALQHREADSIMRFVD